MPTSRGFNTTAEARTEWEYYRCRSDRLVKVALPTTLDLKNWPDGILLPVVPESVDAWHRFADLMERHGVTFDELAGGTYNCRQITGGTLYSLHAYGIALDLNPSRNPYGTSLKTDFPEDFITDVLALRTNSGRRVFRWGGDWDDDPETSHGVYDAMHFEITCNRADLATGIKEDEPMHTKKDHAVYHAQGPAPWGDAAWADYVAARYTTNPDSRTWEARREDLAWMRAKLVEEVGDMIKESAGAVDEAALVDRVVQEVIRRLTNG